MRTCKGELVLRELAGQAEQCVDVVYRHMKRHKRMEENQMVKRIARSDVRDMK